MLFVWTQRGYQDIEMIQVTVLHCYSVRVCVVVGRFIELPSETVTQILASRKTVVISAKL